MVNNYIVLESQVGNSFFTIIDFSSKISFCIDGKEIIFIDKEDLIIDKENYWKNVIYNLKLEEKPIISLNSTNSSLFFVTFTKNYIYVSFLVQENLDILLFKIKLDEDNLLDLLFFLRDFFYLEKQNNLNVKKIKLYFESILLYLKSISCSMKVI